MSSVKRIRNENKEMAIKQKMLKVTVKFDRNNVPVRHEYNDNFKDVEKKANDITEVTDGQLQESSDSAKQADNSDNITHEKDSMNVRTKINNGHLKRTEPKLQQTVKQNDERLKLPPIYESGRKLHTDPSLLNNHHGTAKKEWKKPGDSGELPIQARIRGPGPARYNLPTTFGINNVDITRRQSPAFTFGSRSWSFKSDSPGPAYAFDPLMYTRGKEHKPAYTFGIRPKTPVNRNITPSPAAYNTDVAPLWERKAPHYSISPRNKKRTIDDVPSPNSYMLPSTIGCKVPHQKGGISVSIYPPREKYSYAEDLAKTPGPAKYNPYSPNLLKRQSPQYTIVGRNFAPEPKIYSPGPGEYSPQNVTSHLEQSPRYFIGVRHSEFVLPSITPADISD